MAFDGRGLNKKNKNNRYRYIAFHSLEFIIHNIVSIVNWNIILYVRILECLTVMAATGAHYNIMFTLL